MTAASAITVRAVHEGDAVGAAACVNAAFEPYVERIGRPPAPMLSDYAALAAEGKVWVAEVRGRGFESVYLCTNSRMTENQLLYPRIGYVEYDRRAQSGYERVFYRKRL